MNQEYENNERQIKLGEALKRLQANPDFQAVILEGYIAQLPAQLAQAYVTVHTEASRKGIELELAGVGALQKYFKNIENMAYSAQQNRDEWVKLRDDVETGEGV